MTLKTGRMLLLGLALSVYGFASWEAKSFGPLDPARMLRIAIPGVTALILGLQTLLSSFFLSILGLRRR